MLDLVGIPKDMYRFSCEGDHVGNQMIRVVRKPAFCICENKEADQLRGNRPKNQQNPSTSYIRNFKPLTIFCGCTVRFVWDLVGNSEDRFSHDEAQIMARSIDKVGV